MAKHLTIYHEVASPQKQLEQFIVRHLKTPSVRKIHEESSVTFNFDRFGNRNINSGFKGNFAPWIEQGLLRKPHTTQYNAKENLYGAVYNMNRPAAPYNAYGITSENTIIKYDKMNSWLNVDYSLVIDRHC
jgi:hypothetical protein